MLMLSRREALRARFGWLTGAFLVGYAIARITCEFFREPDVFLRFLAYSAPRWGRSCASRCCRRRLADLVRRPEPVACAALPALRCPPRDARLELPALT